MKHYSYLEINYLLNIKYYFFLWCFSVYSFLSRIRGWLIAEFPLVLFSRCWGQGLSATVSFCQLPLCSNDLNFASSGCSHAHVPWLYFWALQLRFSAHPVLLLFPFNSKRCQLLVGLDLKSRKNLNRLSWSFSWPPSLAPYNGSLFSRSPFSCKLLSPALCSSLGSSPLLFLAVFLSLHLSLRLSCQVEFFRAPEISLSPLTHKIHCISACIFLLLIHIILAWSIFFQELILLLLIEQLQFHFLSQCVIIFLLNCLPYFLNVRSDSFPIQLVFKFPAPSFYWTILHNLRVLVLVQKLISPSDCFILILVKLPAWGKNFQFVFDP